MRHGPTSDVWERMIRYALFDGRPVGRRLQAGLGEGLCARITWHKVSPFVADNPKSYHYPDMCHVQAVLMKHRPRIVMCFSPAAHGLVGGALGEGVVFVPCVNLDCWTRDTKERLDEARQAVEAAVLRSA